MNGFGFFQQSKLERKSVGAEEKCSGEVSVMVNGGDKRREAMKGCEGGSSVSLTGIPKPTALVKSNASKPTHTVAPMPPLAQAPPMYTSPDKVFTLCIFHLVSKDWNFPLQRAL